MLIERFQVAVPRSRSPDFRIRRASHADRELLVDIWWRSAQATHRFLAAKQLEALMPEVRAMHLEKLDTWVLCAPESNAIGFLVMNGRDVDALFIAPEWLRQGGGRLLLAHARALAGSLTVQVNEQNLDALKFYLAHGFAIVARSETDSGGRPYPLLHLAQSVVRP
jgi:putative acetyltransferase